MAGRAGSMSFFDRIVIQWLKMKHAAMNTSNNKGNAMSAGPFGVHWFTFPAKSKCVGTISGADG